MSKDPTRTFYNRMSLAYDAIADAGEHEARERGMAIFAPQPGDHILEIGFGTGHALVDISRFVGPEGRVDGVDISEGMVHVAQRRLAEVGAENVHLQRAEVPPLPFGDATLDGIFMSFTLELFPREELPVVLSEARRVLRPNGRLGIVAMARPAPGEKESVLERTYQWMHRHFPHIVDCRPIDAEGLLRGAGFEIETSERLAIWTLPVALILARRG